jgi:hypothetical protein
MAYNCRCTTKKCRQRVTLRMHPDVYKREPRCSACGGRVKYDPSVTRQTRSRGTCHCDGYPFPHRPHCEPWCRTARRGPSEEDYNERYTGIPEGIYL